MKKGFSLIELILVMAIFCILLSTTMIKISGIKNLENKVDTEMFGNSLVNFINNCKEYCKYKNLKCCIYIDDYSGEINLTYNLKPVMSMKIPKGFSIYNEGGYYTIHIDDKGFVESACSIKFKDREENKFCVSICVGTAHVNFYSLKKDSH